MDFMSQLPLTASGHDAVMAIVDRFTKRGHFVTTRTDATTQGTARLFRDFYQRLHGLPASIVSNRDTKFTSKLWQQIMKLQDTQLQFSPAFRPSTDGQSEATIKFENEYILHFVAPYLDDWDTLLPLCEFAYNARVHSTIGMSPFMDDPGYQPRAVSDRVVPTARQSLTSTFVTHHNSIWAEAQDTMAVAQDRWYTAYDRNRPHLAFEVGDKVLLKTKNLALEHLGTDRQRKFAPRYIGPYLITDITGPDTYKLALPPGLRLHPEYHVPRLRLYQYDYNPARITRLQPVLTTDGTEGHQVHSIIGRRRRKGVRHFKVKGLDTSIGSSWEPLSQLAQIIELIRHYIDTLPATRATALLRVEMKRGSQVRCWR